MNPKTSPGKADPSKHPISRWEKEWKSRRILAIFIAIVIIAAVGVVSYGYYDNNVKPWNQTVSKVNDQSIDMRHFVKMLRLYGAADNPSQIQTIAQYALSTLQNNELVRQKAEDYDIYVDDIDPDEIEEELKNQLNFDADSETEEEFQQRLKDILDARNLSQSDLEELLIIPAILSGKLFDAIGENEFGDEYEHVQVKAVLVGTEEDALQAKADWAGDFNKIIKDYSSTRYYPYNGYWLVRVIEKQGEGDDEEFHIEAMLLATKERADALKIQIDGGSDFATLAKDNSLDSTADDGGDMDFMSLDSIESKFGDLETIKSLALNTVGEPISGNYPDGPIDWLPKDIESSTFDEVVFVEGSESGSPITVKRDLDYSTKSGYWLVMVYEPEEEEEHEEEGLYVKAILLDSKAEAEKLKTDISNGTATFADIVAEYSLDTSSRDNGGDLGWLSHDSIESKFGEDNLETIKALASETTVGTLSTPLKDENTSKKSGYWVIQVLAKEDRILSEDDKFSYSYEFFNTWAGEQTTEDLILDNNSKLSWAIDHL